MVLIINSSQTKKIEVELSTSNPLLFASGTYTPPKDQ